MAISSKKRLQPAGMSPVSDATLVNIQVQIGRAIESVWLVAAFLVPLIVLSEQDFTSFTELPKITLLRSLAWAGLALWLASRGVESVRTVHRMSDGESRFRYSLRSMIVSRPIEFAAAFVVVITAVSAAISIQPVVSALGADWGRDGYDLHTIGAYGILFFLSVAGIRRRNQFLRLWIAISAAGLVAALIGIAQHFAMAPLGIAGTYQHQRVTGTVGNPLFLGALLTLTLPIGAAIALAGATKVAGWPGRAYLWWAGLAVLVFVHAYAAIFTASRGPWLGMAAGVIVLTLLTARLFGLKQAAIMTGVVFTGVVVAVSLVVGPASQTIESFAVAEQQQLFDESESGINRTPADAVEVISQRGREGTVGLRLTIWDTTGNVILERPALPESNNSPWIVRQLFGYGPDTFRFVFPTRAPGEMLGVLTSTAHNAPLNLLVELGVVGLLAYGSLLLSGVFVAWKLMARSIEPGQKLIAVFAVGAGAAVVGRFFEQLSGVAQVSDTTVMWFVLALLASGYALVHRGGRYQEEPSQGNQNGSWAIGLPRVPQPLLLAGITAGVAVAGYLMWMHNINLLRADIEFNRAATAGSVDQVLDHMERAISLNPGVEAYSHEKAESLFVLAERTGDISQKYALLNDAYGVEYRAYEFNPTSRSANFELGYASWQLALLGDSEKARETLETYERLSVLVPSHPLVIERLELLRQTRGSN